ncbi:MAG: hypothetical protein GPJ54_18210 [Candidatus Heimdallarchaeota archaeon]|nr:hypothetical protein [Candidatus Heimdallarchaeota archaeon]
MSSSPKQNIAFQPIMTFVGFVALGVVIAVYINTNANYRLPIILFGFLAGFIIAGAELRAIVRQSQNSSEPNDKELSRDDKMARYVADLFDEDISFDEIPPHNDQANKKN